MKNIEYRVAEKLEIREAPKDSGFIAILSGYAAVYNSDSVRFAGYQKDWVERIAPGAFKRSLTDNPDVIALRSHDTDVPIARAPDTLTLSEDATGLAFEMRLVDITENRDLVTRVKNKIIRGMSFGFEAVQTQWNETPEIDTRTLLDVNLFEISPVAWPAYPDTTIAARSQRGFRELRASVPDLKEVMQEREAFLRPTPAISNNEDTRETRLRILCK